MQGFPLLSRRSQQTTACGPNVTYKPTANAGFFISQRRKYFRDGVWPRWPTDTYDIWPFPEKGLQISEFSLATMETEFGVCAVALRKLCGEGITAIYKISLPDAGKQLVLPPRSWVYLCVKEYKHVIMR